MSSSSSQEENAPAFEETVSQLGGLDPLRRDPDLESANQRYREAKEALAAVCRGGEVMSNGKAARQVP